MMATTASTPASGTRQSLRRKASAGARASSLHSELSGTTVGGASDGDNYDSGASFSSAADSVGAGSFNSRLRAASSRKSSARQQRQAAFEPIDEVEKNKGDALGSGSLGARNPSPLDADYSSSATLVDDSSTPVVEKTLSGRGGASAVLEATAAEEAQPVKRPRGRPRKSSAGLTVANGGAKSGASAAKVKAEPVAERKSAVDDEHKFDRSGNFEFGGTLGVSAMMIGFPLLMWYMWIGQAYYDGKLPLPAEGQSWGDFGRHLVNLVVTGAYPTLKAWAIYWIFFVFEGALYCLAPGVWAHGKPLEHLGGKQLRYYCSAFVSFYVTIAVVAALHVSRIFPLYTILDEFGPLLTVSILSGWIVSFIAYFSALARGAEHRMTGNHIYDFFMGAELNPRMFGILDFKMFFEVRIPWYILFLLSCAAATRQYEQYGYVTPEVAFLCMAHYLYANACSKGEELICTTW